MIKNKCLKAIVFFLFASLLQFQNISWVSVSTYAATIIDSTNPTIPQNLIAANITYTSISLNWSKSTDNIEVRGYQIFRNGKKIITTSKTSYTNTDLLPGTKYVYTLKAYDAAGNKSEYSSTLYVTTLNDNSNPSTPSLTDINSVSYTSLKLQWDASTDNVGVKNYEIYRNDEKVGTTGNIFYNDKNLIPGKSYAYYIRAYDIAGNNSISSNIMYVTTQSDLQKPTIPSGLKTTSINGSSVALTWNNSTDNVKIKGYYIYCNGINTATSTVTHRTIKCSGGLGVYLVWVKAIDTAGNISDSSNKLTVILPKF